MQLEKSAEIIVGSLDAAEGSNIRTRNGTFIVDERNRARKED